ncbi:MAG: zinc ribbon domain-containing protein [Deltaproteobacteria bacterium]|nr:zinc ribbon domain-containing protein [Deltaproteobacteria bacterium]
MKRCPQCGASVDDIAIFCDNCDAVLDTNALLEEEKPGQAPPPPPVRKVEKPQPQIKREPIKSQQVSVKKETPKKPEPPPFVPKSATKQIEPKDTAEVQLRETFEEMTTAFKSMGIGQKAGLISALLSFIFAFFPWVSVPQEGSVPGLDVGGFYLIFIAIAYFTYIVLDFTGNSYILRFEEYRVLILISLGFLGILLCTYRIIFPYDIEESTTVLKNIGLKLDIHRKAGLFLSSASSIGMFISPLLGGFVKRDTTK